MTGNMRLRMIEAMKSYENDVGVMRGFTSRQIFSVFFDGSDCRWQALLIMRLPTEIGQRHD
jgi:hypothetical protein